MCSIAIHAQEVTMATTQLMPAAVCQACRPQTEEARIEFRPPRMSWVVVTDENHNRRVRMNWTP